MDIYSFVFGLTGLLALVCFMPPLAGRVKLPYSVFLAIAGCVLGYLSHVHQWAPPVLGEFLTILGTFEISSDTFLVVFLPILLFEAAFTGEAFDPSWFLRSHKIPFLIMNIGS